MKKDSVILITGSSRGLGRGLALGLAKQGATVIGHFHTSKKEARSLLAELRRINKRCAVYQADLRSETQTKKMIAAIYRSHGRIDVLINNVGSFIYKPIEKTTFEDFRDVIETNLYSTFLCTKLVIHRMKKQKSGQIINIGCAGADRIVIREHTTPYYIAKTGVIMLTKIFAHAYAKYGIRVNAVSPGVLETSIAKRRVKMPSGRYGNFDNILNAVLFLLSPRSSYINGANIEVGGGWMP